MPYTIQPTVGMLTYALGVGSVALLPNLPATNLVVVIGLVAVGLTGWSIGRAPRWFGLATLLVGMTLGMVQGQRWQASRLPQAMIGHDLIIEGTVLGLPVHTDQSARFDFKAHPGVLPDAVNTLRLRWFAPPTTVAAGQQWRLTVRLRRPHGFASPGALDVEAWAAREGLHAMGYVRAGKPLDLSTAGIGALRQQLAQWLDSHTALDNTGLFKALLVGDKSAITPDQWQRFNTTGTTHLLVISGLHIGLMALLGYGLALLLGRLGLLPLARWPLPRWAGLLSLLFAWLYGGIAGFSIPVQRALVMTSVASLAPIIGVKPVPSSLLLTALVVVLTLDPLAVTSAGFWYSFLAVAALLYGLANRVGQPSTLAKIAKPQWLVFCVLSPLLLFNGQPVSVLSPVINGVAIPFIGLLIVPLLLVAAGISMLLPTAAAWLLSGLDALLQGLQWGLEQSTAAAALLPCFAEVSVSAMILAVIGALLLLAPAPLRLRLLAPMLFLPWCFPTTKQPALGQAEVTVLDVGQGLSVLIRTHQHTLVYDTGDGVAGSFNAADQVIIPYLRQAGVRTVDQIIISHGDKDHCGGLLPLTAQFSNARVCSGTRIPNYHGAITPCRPGQQWQWDGVTFTVLSGGGKKSNTNDCSCVLKVSAGDDSLLLPGDISARVERRLLASGQPMHAKFLLASHHGSRYANSDAFLTAVKPEVVLFSAGYHNRFGHPAPATLKRVAQLGAQSWNTATDGSLSFTLGTGTTTVSAYRNSHRRYWWY